jgi:hypothetical protein
MFALSERKSRQISGNECKPFCSWTWAHYRGYYRSERRIIPLKEDNSAALCGRNEFPEEAKLSQGTVWKFRRPAPSLSTAVQRRKNMAWTEALHSQQCCAFRKRQVIPSVLNPTFVIYQEYVVTKVHSAPFLSRGSAVGIATAYRLNDRGVGFRVPVG